MKVLSLNEFVGYMKDFIKINVWKRERNCIKSILSDGLSGPKINPRLDDTHNQTIGCPWTNCKSSMYWNSRYKNVLPHPGCTKKIDTWMPSTKL